MNTQPKEATMSEPIDPNSETNALLGVIKGLTAEMEQLRAENVALWTAPPFSTSPEGLARARAHRTATEGEHA